MKCESCGMSNPEGMRFCGVCGRPLAAPPAGPAEARSRNCVQCGRPIVRGPSSMGENTTIYFWRFILTPGDRFFR